MLEEKIYADYVTALKQKNKEVSGFLSFIRSGLKNIAIDLKKDKLDDDQVLSALKKEQKRLTDTIESIEKSNRDDLLEITRRELNILQSYLPQALSEEELSSIIDETIKETQATSIKDMGKVMKSALAKAGVRADTKKISTAVQKKLAAL